MGSVGTGTGDREMGMEVPGDDGYHLLQQPGGERLDGAAHGHNLGVLRPVLSLERPPGNRGLLLVHIWSRDLNTGL